MPHPTGRSIAEGWPPLAHRRQLEMVAARQRASVSQRSSKASNPLEKTLEDIVPDSLRGESSANNRRRDVCIAPEMVLKAIHGIGIY